MVRSVPCAPATLTDSYDLRKRGTDITKVDCQFTVFRKSVAWLGVIPATSKPISASRLTSSSAGTFTTGLGPSLRRTQSLNCVLPGVGPVILLAISLVAVAGPGQVPYCTSTARGMSTDTAAPSTDAG